MKPFTRQVLLFYIIIYIIRTNSHCMSVVGLKEAAFLHRGHVVGAYPAPGVALEVQGETYDEMKPVRWQVQDVAGLQDNLVGPGLGELGIELQIRLAPVHRRVPSAGMVLGVEGHVGALLGMGQDVPPFSAHDGNGIAAEQTLAVIDRNRKKVLKCV